MFWQWKKVLFCHLPAERERHGKAENIKRYDEKYQRMQFRTRELPARLMTQSKQKSQEIQIKSDFLASTLNFNNLDLI